MGYYSQVVFPCLCDLVMRQPFLAPYRRELLAAVSGDILEIGFGTGLNLPFYPPQVRKLTAVDPNVGMHARAKKRIAQSGIEVDRRVLDCEWLPFAAKTFDCVVSTWTLCSITNVQQAMNEVYRVLKPSGRFLFLEHGLSPEPRVQKWQHRFSRLAMRLGGGCRLDRDIKAIVTAQPFVSVPVQEFYGSKFLRTHGYMYRGAATK